MSLKADIDFLLTILISLLTNICIFLTRLIFKKSLNLENI